MIGSVTIVRPQRAEWPIHSLRCGLWRGLEARADGAQDGIDPAAQQEQSGDSENGDECEDECVLRETLSFLAAREREQGSLLD